MLGLDPDPARLWPQAAAAADAGGVPATTHDRAAAAVLAHCRAVVDAVAPAVVAVKPQVACFERLGPPGRTVLAAVCEHARGLGLLVLADAKRGDIDVTARAYAEAFLGSTPSPFGTLEGLGADAMTAGAVHGGGHPAPAHGGGPPARARDLRPRPHLQPRRGGPRGPRDRGRRRARVGARGAHRRPAGRDPAAAGGPGGPCGRRRRGGRHGARARRPATGADAAHAVPPARRRGAGRAAWRTSPRPGRPGAPRAW
jgi:hypothetical protein